MSSEHDSKEAQASDPAEVVPLTPEMGGGCWPPLLAFAVSIVIFVALILPGVQALRIADKWAALLALGGWGASFFLLLPLFVRWAARGGPPDSKESPLMADFRSDTITRPTEAMRSAMAAAEVGDDVFGEDPTVNRLQEQAAALLGKQAGLFVPSGTMANLLALMAQAEPGSEVIVEARSHIMNSELAGAGRLAGVLLRPLETTAGRFDQSRLKAAIRPAGKLWSHTTLVCVENTHNFWGGRVYPLGAFRELSELVRGAGLPLHLDGARIFNACAASGVAPRDYGALCDSVSVCLSKGLSAPVGSLLLSSHTTIDRARRLRKMLGGGMRQAGVVAAAGLVALEQMRERLVEDHRSARRLAEGLAELGLQVDLEAVETNILFVSCGDAIQDAQLVAELALREILAFAVGELGIRFVTHRGIGRAEVDAALRAVAEIRTQHR